MSYNNDGGCCNGGLNMPFSIPFPGTQSNGWGNSNDMFGMLMMLLFFSLFGFGNNGFGGRPMPFMGCTGGGGNIAAEAAAYVGQQNTADKVSGIATGVDAIAGIATANGVKVETVKDLTAAGFAGVNTNLCELGNNIAQQFSTATMNGMQNHNNLTSQLTEMRFANQQCCCDTKQLIQSSFCNLAHQIQSDKADTMRAIADSTAAITARLDAAEKAALQEKINQLTEQKATLKAQLDNQSQTSTLLAAIQAQCAPKCSPCAPACNPCDPQQILQKALYENWVAKTLDTTTTTSAA